ncbi:unnamed protein product [Echinostoma caproni]|uniref:G_PROTEIN_RECEP_F1_2 domain-containing protein n=1 Tax=Echinostoma caproni TaxID=27848 RepID=A0A183ASA7_9TREM|nr:unnamed protein product [Echinostoma caproni]
MTWTSFWCGITTWSEDLSWNEIHNLHDPNVNQSRRYVKLNVTDATESYNQVWCFHMDLVLVALLATLSLVANMGLLYLARLTKPLVQITHSSFSMTGPLSPFTIPPTQTNNNNNNNNSTGIQTASPTRKSSFSARRLLCCQPVPKLSLTDQFYNSLMQNSASTAGLLRKCSSSVSISRMANSSITNPVGIPSTNGRAPRTRRHRRYLKGLLGLSVSNLTVAFSLFLWCVCHITEDRILLPWLALLTVGNHALADIAQSLEIGAVLWIALERTLGIHWPRERRPSSPNVNKTKPDMSVRKQICQALCPRWLARLKHSRFVVNMRTFDPPRCVLAKCLPCANDCGLGSNLALKARLHRKLRCVTRSLLSLFPLILFILAAVHSTQALIRPLLNNRKRTNFSSVFFLTERMLMELQTNPSDERFPTEWRQNMTISTSTTNNNKTTRFFTITYYTNSIVSALVVGQFIAPLAILITTNLLIYRKVGRITTTNPKSISLSSLSMRSDLQITSSDWRKNILH